MPRPTDPAIIARAVELIKAGASWNEIARETGLSNSTIGNLKKRIKEGTSRADFMKMTGQPQLVEEAEPVAMPAEEPEASPKPSEPERRCHAPAAEACPSAKSPFNAHLCDEAPDGRCIRMSGATPIIDYQTTSGNEAFPIKYCPWCGVKLA